MKNQNNKTGIKLLDIKKNASYLKVMGAFVQDPNPGVYGLKDDELIESVDASALYPTIEVLLNIGYETLYGRAYDVGINDNLINLFKAIEKNRDKGDAVLNQAKTAFNNALQMMLKNYTSRKSVGNKKEFTEVNIKTSMTFFIKIAKSILSGIDLKDIFEPKDDKTYFLLRSNLYPLMETINWLSEKNKGYSQLIVDYIYHMKEFYSKYAGKTFYIFENISSTKIQLKEYNNENIDDLFLRLVLSPYGTLFYKHEDKLAYTVSENMAGLKRRRKVKNAMLCLEGIIDNFNTLTEEEINIFLNAKDDVFLLSEDQLQSIFEKVDAGDPKIIPWRISSLKDFEFQKKFINKKELKEFISLRVQQLNSVQLGIKVTLNSGYGITGLITYQWANPLLGNSITNGGKIYGIKTFQQVAVATLQKEFKKD